MPTPVRYPSGVSTAVKGSALFNHPAEDPTKLISYWNDFTTEAAPVAADWTITLVNSASNPVIYTDAHGGVLLFTTTGAENDGVQIQKKGEFWLPAAAKKFWFKTRFKVSEATQSDFLIGMTVTDTTAIAADGDGVTDGVFFQKDDGSTSVGLYCQKDATTGQLITTGVHTLVDDTYVSLGYYYDGTRYLKYYVNDVHTGTADLTTTVTTYLPDTELTVTLALLTGSAAARTMSTDYVYFAAER